MTPDHKESGMRRSLAAAAVAAMALLILPTTASAQSGASVYVIHGVPGLVADVWVSGERTLEEFAFGTVTDALSLPAGDYHIDILPTGADPASEEPILSLDTTVTDGANVSIVAHLDPGGTPMFSVFDNDVSPVTPGTARATFRHTAQAPPIDVRAAGTPAVVALTNPGEATVEPVPATTLPLDIVMSGTSDVVFGPADVNFESGSVVIAYAVGSAADDTFDVLVQAVPAQPSGGSAATGDDGATTGAAADMPTAVPAGSGGLADATGLPVVALAVAAAALVVLAGSGAVLIRNRS